MALVLEHRCSCSRAGDAESDPPGWIGRAVICCGLASRSISAPSWCCSRWVCCPCAIATEPLFRCRRNRLVARPDRCAFGILVGVLGWFVVTVVAASALRRLGRSSPAGVDTQLLREIVDLLRARRPSRSRLPPKSSNSSGNAITRRWRRSRNWPGLISRIRNGIFEIQHGLQQRGPEQAGQGGSAALADVARPLGALRAATAALTAAATKLEDIAAGLAALSRRLAYRHRHAAITPPGSRSQLSTELQELLRDMATGSAPRQEGPADGLDWPIADTPGRSPGHVRVRRLRRAHAAVSGRKASDG